MEGGGFMPECYVTKREYWLECDKPLHRGGGGVKMTIFSVTHFLNDPKMQSLLDWKSNSQWPEKEIYILYFSCPVLKILSS